MVYTSGNFRVNILYLTKYKFSNPRSVFQMIFDSLVDHELSRHGNMQNI